MQGLKVLYIAGSGRCGSTVLASILGSFEGFVNVGEARFLFNQKMQLRNTPCGCGSKVDACPLWSPLVQHISRSTVEVLTTWSALKVFPAVYTLQRIGTVPTKLSQALLQVERTYHEVAKVTGARVIIDSSKHPTYGLLLAQLPSIDLYVVHLVRDGRGVVKSWQAAKGYLTAHHPSRTALQWVLYNLVAERIVNSARYVRVRWEDFVERPEGYLSTICKLIAEPMPELHKQGEAIVIPQQHSLAGNPDKFTGSLRLRSAATQLGATRGMPAGIMYPLLKRYGYVR